MLLCFSSYHLRPGKLSLYMFTFFLENVLSWVVASISQLDSVCPRMSEDIFSNGSSFYFYRLVCSAQEGRVQMFSPWWLSKKLIKAQVWSVGWCTCNSRRLPPPSTVWASRHVTLWPHGHQDSSTNTWSGIHFTKGTNKTGWWQLKAK